ncbi:cardiolipin synthase [Mycoplasmatota bacterium WC44]
MRRKLFTMTILLTAGVLTYLGFEYIIKILSKTLYTQILSRVGLGVLVVTTWISVLFRSDKNANNMPWLLLLTLVPVLGIVLFLSFGRDYKKSSRYKARNLLENEGYLSYEPENDIEILPDEVKELFTYTSSITKHHIYSNDTRSTVLTNGAEFFNDLIKKIENAKKFIFLQFYIIKSDALGKYILDMLIDKAKSGVEIKIMYDYFGGQEFNRKYIKKLKGYGIEVIAIDKVLVPILNTRVNYRNHRKVVIIDGEYGYTGGFNIGSEYLFGTKKYKWRDTHLLIEGNMVKSLTAVFVRDWYYVTNEFINDSKYFKHKEVSEAGYLQVLQSGPDTAPNIRNTYIKLITNAKKSIKITTPYLGLDSETLLALTMAAQSGIKVEIIIPGVPDKMLVYKVTESFIELLLKSGVHIYKLKDTFTHAKVLIIDDLIASCGTYNFDIRSSMINFEVTILMYNNSVRTLVNDFKNDVENSNKVLLEEWNNRSFFNKLFTELFKLITPLT